jgi:hypothetical protein
MFRQIVKQLRATADQAAKDGRKMERQEYGRTLWKDACLPEPASGSLLARNDSQRERTD